MPYNTCYKCDFCILLSYLPVIHVNKWSDKAFPIHKWPHVDLLQIKVTKLKMNKFLLKQAYNERYGAVRQLLLSMLLTFANLSKPVEKDKIIIFSFFSVSLF